MVFSCLETQHTHSISSFLLRPVVGIGYSKCVLVTHFFIWLIFSIIAEFLIKRIFNRTVSYLTWNFVFQFFLIWVLLALPPSLSYFERTLPSSLKVVYTFSFLLSHFWWIIISSWHLNYQSDYWLSSTTPEGFMKGSSPGSANYR